MTVFILNTTHFLNQTPTYTSYVSMFPNKKKKRNILRVRFSHGSCFRTVLQKECFIREEFTYPHPNNITLYGSIPVATEYQVYASRVELYTFNSCYSHYKIFIPKKKKKFFLCAYVLNNIKVI